MTKVAAILPLGVHLSLSHYFCWLFCNPSSADELLLLPGGLNTKRQTIFKYPIQQGNSIIQYLHSCNERSVLLGGRKIYFEDDVLLNVFIVHVSNSNIQFTLL